MTALGFAVLVFGVWTALGIVTLLAVVPLLRLAPQARPEKTSEPASAFRESGYLGIVLERLSLHATTIFGADQVCVFGRDTRERDDRLVLVQGTGVSPDLIGRQLDIHWDPMVAARPCRAPRWLPSGSAGASRAPSA